MANRLCVSLNSWLESKIEEEDTDMLALRLGTMLRALPEDTSK